MIQYITRKISIDCGHRVMNHAFKCNNYHGHTYLVELTFGFDKKAIDPDLGYAMDFGEIKRVGIQWLMDKMDHGFIANPRDTDIIKVIKENEMRLYLMSLNGGGNYCNPSAENIAVEMFLAISKLMNKENLEGELIIWLDTIILYETPNNFVTTNNDSILPEERLNFLFFRERELEEYKKQMGSKLYKK